MRFGSGCGRKMMCLAVQIQIFTPFGCSLPQEESFHWHHWRSILDQKRKSPEAVLFSASCLWSFFLLNAGPFNPILLGNWAEATGSWPSQDESHPSSTICQFSSDWKVCWQPQFPLTYSSLVTKHRRDYAERMPFKVSLFLISAPWDEKPAESLRNLK